MKSSNPSQYTNSESFDRSYFLFATMVIVDPERTKKKKKINKKDHLERLWESRVWPEGRTAFREFPPVTQSFFTTARRFSRDESEPLLPPEEKERYETMRLPRQERNASIAFLLYAVTSFGFFPFRGERAKTEHQADMCHETKHYFPIIFGCPKSRQRCIKISCQVLPHRPMRK